MELRRRFATLLVAAACVTLGLALLTNEYDTSPSRVELTFWDGAAADEPGYAEEASQQIDTGLFGYNTGYWEEPGYWNNRGLGDGAESQMDARMFADAANNNYFHTGGADFLDTDSLYNDATDADSVSLDGTYNDAWPGTGAGLYGYDNIQSENDAYHGEWEVDPLDTEAANDAAVSGSDIGGFKQVGTKHSQILSQVKCDRCYSGSDCVAGCRLPANRASASRQPTAHKKQPLQTAHVKGAAQRQMALAKKHSSAAPPSAVVAPSSDKASFGGLGGFSLEGLRTISSPGMLCGQYACAVGGLWGKACGCSGSDERAAKEAEEREEAQEHRVEEEHEAEAAAEEENREEWLGLHGIVLDASPLAERWMPEQHNELPAAMQDWSTFWSPGQKLRTLGLKV